MPRGDGTGPMGFGPMTERAAGHCAGYGMPGFMNPVPGFGAGARFGRGRGGGFWGHGGGFYGAPAVPAMTKEQQGETLKRQAEFLEEQLDSVKKHMEELSAPDAAEAEK